MNSAIYSAGRVGTWLDTVVQDMADTDDGRTWLKSYIDPAHGECFTVPDEDNNPSIALRTNFTQSIDYDFFVQPGYEGPTPANLTFAVIATPWPEYPIAIYGTYYLMSQDSTPKPIASTRIVLISDQNFASFRSNNQLTELRGMYKGCTITYSGNEYNNEGTVTCVSTVAGRRTPIELSSNYVELYTADSVPYNQLTASNASRDFKLFRIREGAYMVQKYCGQRSEYKAVGAYGITSIGSVSWTRIAAEPYNGFFFYADRFSIPTNGSSLAINFDSNFNWCIAAISNLNTDQSLQLRSYQGWQCHFNIISGYNIIQTMKSYLDITAITNASKINSQVDSLYPASFNDFKRVWNNILRTLRSPKAKLFYSSVGDLLGPQGRAVANAINSFIYTVYNKHNNYQDRISAYHQPMGQRSP